MLLAADCNTNACTHAFVPGTSDNELVLIEMSCSCSISHDSSCLWQAIMVVAVGGISFFSSMSIQDSYIEKSARGGEKIFSSILPIRGIGNTWI